MRVDMCHKKDDEVEGCMQSTTLLYIYIYISGIPALRAGFIYFIL